MKTNVYQYQENPFTGTRAFVQIGTVVGNNITPDLVWHLTNWACWLGDDKINRIKQGFADIPIDSDDCVYNRTSSDKGFSNHDIMLDIDGVWYTAEWANFAKFDTFDEAKQHLIETNS